VFVPQVSLASTLTTIVAGAGAAAAPTAPSKVSGAKTLSKPLVLQKDAASDKAILAAVGGDENFGALARAEGAALLGRCAPLPRRQRERGRAHG